MAATAKYWDQLRRKFPSVPKNVDAAYWPGFVEALSEAEKKEQEKQVTTSAVADPVLMEPVLVCYDENSGT